MAFKPGESGNPSGTRREKQFLSALERAIAQDSADRLRKAAEKLLDEAAAGQPWAINALADRLDGRPTQQVDMNVTRETRELSDSELSNIAAGSSEGTAAATTSPKKPSQLH